MQQYSYKNFGDFINIKYKKMSISNKIIMIQMKKQGENKK